MERKGWRETSDGRDWGRRGWGGRGWPRTVEGDEDDRPTGAAAGFFEVGPRAETEEKGKNETKRYARGGRLQFLAIPRWEAPNR